MGHGLRNPDKQVPIGISEERKHLNSRFGQHRWSGGQAMITSIGQANGARFTVLAVCQSPIGRCLVRGVAAELGLDLRVTSSAGTILGMTVGTILLVESIALDDDAMRLLTVAQQASGVAAVVVGGEVDPTIRDRVTRSGAILCLNTAQDMFTTLSGLVTSMATHLSEHGRRPLPICGKLRLVVPGLYLTDGIRIVQLPRIPGALLGCLASRPNSVVSSRDLILGVWGSENGATPNALYQQILQLRGRLEEFGVSHLLSTVRGRGYRLECRTPDPLR